MQLNIQQPPHHDHKLKKAPKLAVRQPELASSKATEALRTKDWATTIISEVDLFEKTIQKVDALFKEAETSEHLISLGHHQLLINEYNYASSKLTHLRELVKQFQDSIADYRAKKQKLKALVKKEGKTEEEQTEIKKLLREQQAFKYTITKARDTIQLQFNIAQRILVLVQVYIDLKNQYQNAHDLQKHRDYILQKISKIKKSEEKNVKRIERHYNRIVVEDNNEAIEVEEEEDDEEIEEEVVQNTVETQRAQLLQLCESLVSYLQKFENAQQTTLLQYDLATFQQFDSVRVAAPFQVSLVPQTIESLKARRVFLETAPESEFVRKQVTKTIQQQQQQQNPDVNNEKDFPKLQ